MTRGLDRQSGGESPGRPRHQLAESVFGEAEFSLILDDRWHLTNCSEAFARWLGYDDSRELQGVALAETLDPASRPQLAEVANRLATGPPLAVELKHRDRQGRPVVARYDFFAPGSLGSDQLRVMALGSDRQVILGLLEEIIDLKRQREAQLATTRELNGRLEQQNADLAAISHMINHDVSNSLNAINLTATVLERRGPPTPEQVRRATGEIQGLCRHVAGMMKGFVALADVAHTPLRLGSVDLAGVAREMLGMVAANRPEVRHQVVYRFEAPMVYADLNHVRQVFENLLSNAFKYRDPARPVLSLRLSSRKGEGETTVIEVADNALGIPVDRQATIFDLHTRAHAQVSEGHGVGLAIVRRLVEANGGAISLESRPGVGSTFRIALPSRPGSADLSEIR